MKGDTSISSEKIVNDNIKDRFLVRWLVWFLIRCILYSLTLHLSHLVFVIWHSPTSNAPVN